MSSTPISALARIAASLLIVAASGPVFGGEVPAGSSDDLYLNACDSYGYEAAPTEAKPVESPQPSQKAVQAQPCEADCCFVVTKVEAAAPKAVQAAGDDLFLHLVTPLSAPSLAKSAHTVQVTEALEVVPTPNTFGLQSPTPGPITTPSTKGLNRPIVTLTLDAAAAPELVANLSKLKTDVAINDESIDQFGSWDAPTGEASAAPARFTPQNLNWAAPAVYTNPLYFEQPNLERYGHYVGVCDRDNLTQSAISAAHFFVSVPALPYKIGAECPTECNYVLGTYRPGSCNPHQLVKPPLSLRGLVFEGAAATGLVFFLP